MPADIVLDLNEQLEVSNQSVDDYVGEKQEAIIEAYRSVRETLGVAAERRKKYYDTKVSGAELQVGTWVWYHYQRRKQGLSPKWQSYYTGPYLIIKVLSAQNMVIQKTRKSVPFVVHRDKVKPCYAVDQAPWVAKGTPMKKGMSDASVQCQEEGASPRTLQVSLTKEKQAARSAMSRHGRPQRGQIQKPKLQ